MCLTVFLDGNEYESVGDLKKICGKLVISKSYEKGYIELPESCLCCVNIPKTAEVNGFSWDYTNTFMSIILTRKRETIFHKICRFIGSVLKRIVRV